MIKYSKNIQYIEPFVTILDGLVPLKKIKSIKAYKPNKNKEIQTYAITTQRNGRYSINIRLYDYSKKTKQYTSIPFYFFLDTLAHELAHVVHWEHTPQHYKLQSEIQNRIAVKLMAMKFKDTQKRCEGLFK